MNKSMSAVFVWNSIVLLQRQGKDCVSMKWAIDLYDESSAPRWECHTARTDGAQVRTIAVRSDVMYTLTTLTRSGT